MNKHRMRYIFALLTILAFCAAPKSYADDLQDNFSTAKEKYTHFRQTVKDFTILQDMEMDGSDGIETQEAQLVQIGDKFRIEFNADPLATAKKQFTVTYDGKTTWLFSPSSEKKEITYPESKKYQRDSVLWDHLLKNGQPLRDELVGNYDCFVVEVKDEMNTTYTLWIEKVTFNLIQAEGQSDEFGKVNFWNSDFRKVEGDWEIPYRMEIYVANKLIATNTIKSVQANQGLDIKAVEPNAADGTDQEKQN